MTAYRPADRPLHPHRHPRRGGVRAGLGRRDDDAAWRRRGARRPACRARRTVAFAAERAGPGRRPRRGGSRCRDARSLAAANLRLMRKIVYPGHRAAARPGGSAGARQFRLRKGLARGPPRRGFRRRATAVRGSRAPGARGRHGPGAGAGPVALRRADGRLPARPARAATVAPVFADYELFLRRALPQAEERQARQPTPMRPQGPFPIAAQEALVPPAVGTPRARFQPRAAGPLGASVLRRHAHRRAHHHALRRGGLRAGGARGGA